MPREQALNRGCEQAMDKLESTIGYTFSDRTLLRRAMTHSSYSNESGERNHHLLCNERLEFLGDSVLSLAVSRYLFATYPQEGEGTLTNMRKDVVCAEALARYARTLRIGDCLYLGNGEELSGGRNKENILADAFEALLAAIYLDDGHSMEFLRVFLLGLMKEELAACERSRGGDYKTRLQQLVQQDGKEVLSYAVVSEAGPDHDKVFEVCAMLNSNPIGKGRGHSKREAEQAAAKEALALFGVSDDE